MNIFNIYADVDAISMTPSRNTRSYTLRSVPSSPGRSFLQFTRYCVEKILAKISDRGEKMANFRYAYDWYTLCILGVCHLRLPCKKPATLFHFFWFTDLSFFPSCWSSTQTNAMLWIQTSTHRSHFENWFPFCFFCALLNSHGFCFFSFDFCGGRGPG